jgi:hypothetical protein
MNFVNCKSWFQTESVYLPSQILNFTKKGRFRNSNFKFYQEKDGTISFLGYSLFSRNDPGDSWSLGSQKIYFLRVCGKSVILHASTSALYTSSQGVGVFVQSTLRITYTWYTSEY